MVSHSHGTGEAERAEASTAGAPSGPDGGPKRPSPEVSRDAVLTAAYEALVHYGPTRATLTDVARRAGVSRMTVYRRYDTLSKLMSAVLTAELVDLLQTVDRHVRSGTDAERVAALVAESARLIAEHPLMSRLLALEPESLLPVIVARRGSTQVAAERLLGQIIAESGDGSILAPDPHRAAQALVTMASAFVFTSARPGDAHRPEWSDVQRLALGYLTGGA